MVELNTQLNQLPVITNGSKQMGELIADKRAMELAGIPMDNTIRRESDRPDLARQSEESALASRQGTQLEARSSDFQNHETRFVFESNRENLLNEVRTEMTIEEDEEQVQSYEEVTLQSTEEAMTRPDEPMKGRAFSYIV